LIAAAGRRAGSGKSRGFVSSVRLAVASEIFIVAAINFGERGIRKSESTLWKTKVLTKSSASKIAYAIETLAECLADARALFPDHWDEIGSNKEVRRYNPDLDLRCLLEEKNRLVVATARDFGRLIGYIDWIIHADPQCKDQLTAETDIYFVEDRPNRALIMRALIRESLTALRGRGVLIARPRTKLKKDGPGRGAGLLWQRLGFKPLEIIYSRNLLTDA
jgi:GNAT superfamily N-acetyltransferase